MCRHSPPVHVSCRFFNPPNCSFREDTEGVPLIKTSESSCHFSQSSTVTAPTAPNPWWVFIQGWSQRWTALRESLTNLYSVAMIRRKLKAVEPFRPVEFARLAQDMFVATNAALQQRNKQDLRRLTTENALEVGRQWLGQQNVM